MKVIRLFILAGLFLFLPQLIKRDFKIPPIHADIPNNPNWDTPPPNNEILEILAQPFFYLSQGGQSTVFQSQDGKYVLKLFRYRPTLFPIIHKIKNLIHRKRQQDFKSKMEKTFNAAYLAYAEARDFTQVLYCHLNLSKNLLPTIQLNINGTHYLALDRYRFVLQKKVDSFKKTILSATSDRDRMQRLIRSLHSLLLNRSALNIRNTDPNLEPNFGFLDENAVELDFGNYVKITSNPDARKREIENYLNRFAHWLEKNDPNSTEILQKFREELLK
jgi:hypothetical protein